MNLIILSLCKNKMQLATLSHSIEGWRLHMQGLVEILPNSACTFLSTAMIVSFADFIQNITEKVAPNRK